MLVLYLTNKAVMCDFASYHKPLTGMRIKNLIGSTQPPMQWLPEALSLKVKQPELEADHSPPSGAEIEDAWTYASISPYSFTVWYLVRHRNILTLHDVHLDQCFLLCYYFNTYRTYCV
jgi:hypothetical protein